MRDTVDYAYGGNAEYINDTAAHTGTFKYGYCATDVVLSAITVTGNLTGNSIIGDTFSKGTMLPIPFSSITLASGHLWAVRGF